jgi:uncharacterized protein
MKLEHDFAVPAPIDEAWRVLLDVERVAPCMPGATLLTVDGDEFTGTVKVKVGPIQVTYKGLAKFAERDENAHRAVIEATGKEARGTGTAAATVTAVLTSSGPESTQVKVETDLNVTGRPAQFGRGVMEEVAAKLIGQFANCLADELSEGARVREEALDGLGSEATDPASADEGIRATDPNASSRPEAPTAAASTSAPAAEAPPTPRVISQAREAEPIDLLEVAGGSVAKRAIPVVAALVVLLLIVMRRRRRE